MPVVPFLPQIIPAVGTATTALVGQHMASNANKDATQAQIDASERSLQQQREIFAEQQAADERARQDALSRDRFTRQSGVIDRQEGNYRYDSRLAQAAPYRDVGYSALSDLSRGMGLPVPEREQLPERPYSAQTLADLGADPPSAAAAPAPQVTATPAPVPTGMVRVRGPNGTELNVTQAQADYLLKRKAATQV